MQGVYGGLIIIIMYAAGEGAIEEQFELITDDNIFILTDLSQGIIVQE